MAEPQVSGGGTPTPPPPAANPLPQVTASYDRRPKRFHLASYLVFQVTALVALGLAGGVHQLAYHRLELSDDGSTILAILALAFTSLAGGILAGRLGRRLAVLEGFVSCVLGFGLFAGIVAGVAGLGLVPWGRLATLGAGPVIGIIAAGAGAVLFFGFIGASVGYLVGGQGGIDTGFSYEWYIARRHLTHKKRTSFLSFITVLSVCAVALGVWCLVVVLSVMSGFEDDLKQKILGTNAHAVVLKYATPFEKHTAVAEKVRGVDGVVGVSPFILGQVMVSSEDQVDGVLIKGVLPEHVGEVTDLPNNVQSGKGDLDFLTHPEKLDPYLKANPGAGDPVPGFPKPTTESDDDAATGEGAGTEDGEGEAEARAPPKRARPTIAIGKELARSMRVFVGDNINVISPISNDMGPTGPVPRSKTFRVGAIFYTGMYEYDSKFAYIHLAEAQKFFDMDDAVTGLELRTTDIDDTRSITRRIMVAIEGYPYYTKDWGEMNKNLFSALKLEKLVMGVILAFIVLVASFVILATLIMMVMEKGKEIAILKSMGARDASIMKIFVLEGLVVGLIGTALGLLLGLGTCAFIASGIISLDPEVYYIESLPVRIEPTQVALVCVIAVVLSYLATIYPSVTASRLHPVEGLRDD